MSEPLRPGHYWKVPFVWDPQCPLPAASATLTFESAPDDWLLDAVARVMGDSLDESDRHAVTTLGAAGAASELLALAPRQFELRAGWWRVARDAQHRAVGFVLPVLFQRKRADAGLEGTIFYMGVLPEHRGLGHAVALLGEAARVFRSAGCASALCDTGERNQPMVAAFRRAGYRERTRWQRALA
jgi:ribosomal protein S18 acetylase RimI-like enzyme